MDPRAKAEAARAASLVLATASDAARRRAVEAFARRLEDEAAAVEAANAEDLRAAEADVIAGRMTRALFDRLPLSGAKLRAAVEGVRAVAALPDPLGRTIRATLLDDGLRLYQVTAPLGVVVCAFESRPDAAVQVASLAMRTGNAVLLKGGKEAAASNAAVVARARAALAEAGLPEDGVVLVEGREELSALLALDDLVDLVVPRGSAAFVRHVQERTRVPVLGHAEGVCHMYLDRSADAARAVPLVLDAKLDYPAACNALECVLVDRTVAPTLVPRVVSALRAKGVEVRADAEAREHAPEAKAADASDFGREFGDLVLALAVVDGVDEAVAFVNRHGSKHTDAVVAEDRDVQRRFVEGVDTANVFVNASTRFSDGFRYGLGAEVGISTGKVHARGPVGLDGLTTTKWILLGEGQTVASYRGDSPRPFRHEPLPEGWTSRR